ncbi:methyltransferase [Niveomyces insectorum RCEF 264]|uniref:Methyltransferase n=1 Tax=Niveomyces insectorum RCEF 264 TaxID=1081102 RepID=A0A167RU56_9HYPO|nr:methyltransferase [Niveomyces insectorum RCEF 264]
MGVVGVVRYLLDPWLFMASSALYLPSTIFHLIRRRQWSTLFRWHRLRSAWFGNFWVHVGPQVREGGETVVIPLLQGRVRHGRVLEDGEKKKTSPPLSGTVVEVGAGSGLWVSVFRELGCSMKPSSSSSSSSSSFSSSSSKSGSGGSSKSGSRQRKSSASTSGVITKIYGVEPNAAVHDSLREHVAAAGLQGVYEIVPTGIEDLAATGKIAKGSVDCIVSILCLCGIPEPEHNIHQLYGYLKPGGRMYVYEHVRCTRHWTIALYQRLVNLFWPSFLGGCQLRRETGRYLREAGPWTSVDLVQPVAEPWYHVVPHIVGVLTK